MESRGTVRRATAAVTVAVLALGASACGERARAGTAGDKHDVCEGLRYYNALDEPDPADLEAVAQWADDADAIIGQISFKRRYIDKGGDERPAPAEVRKDVGTVAAAVERFRDAVHEADADDPAAAAETVRAADRRLFIDAAANEAGRRLEEFLATQCG